MTGPPDTANPLVNPEHDARWYVHGPIWKCAARNLYDRLAVALLDRDPASAFRSFAAVGRALHTCGLQRPSAGDVSTLFGTLTHRQAVRVAQESAALRLRNRAAIAWTRARGLSRLAALVKDGHARNPPPIITDHPRGLILVAYHVGAYFGAGAALVRWGVPALTLRDLSLTGVDARARALKQAVDALRAGGVVVAVCDGPGGASCQPLDCLSRRILLRRGPFMLARVTGAPVVPLIARWTPDGHVVIHAGSELAIAPGLNAAVEQSLAEGAAGWLERHLLTFPGDIWPYTLRNFLRAPQSYREQGTV